MRRVQLVKKESCQAQQEILTPEVVGRWRRLRNRRQRLAARQIRLNPPSASENKASRRRTFMVSYCYRMCYLARDVIVQQIKARAVLQFPFLEWRSDDTRRVTRSLARNCSDCRSFRDLRRQNMRCYPSANDYLFKHQRQMAVGSGST
jgi:hypothetical protein